MRKDSGALPHAALAAHSPPQGLTGAQNSCLVSPKRLKARVSADRSRGEKGDLLKVFFAGVLEMAGVEGIHLTHVLPTAGRSGSCLTVGYTGYSTPLNRLGSKRGQTKMCQSRAAGTLPARPSPL